MIFKQQIAIIQSGSLRRQSDTSDRNQPVGGQHYSNLLWNGPAHPEMGNTSTCSKRTALDLPFQLPRLWGRKDNPHDSYVVVKNRLLQIDPWPGNLRSFFPAI
jgi:hypothetical protein